MNSIKGTCKIMILGRFRKSSKNNLRTGSLIPSPRGSQVQLKATRKLFRGRCVGLYETPARCVGFCCVSDAQSVSQCRVSRSLLRVCSQLLTCYGSFDCNQGCNQGHRLGGTSTVGSTSKAYRWNIIFLTKIKMCTHFRFFS
jgi:hypothetical protein